MSKQMTDTAIVIENDSWKVKVYLGLGGLVTLVILGFLYRFEAGIIALAIGLATAGRVAFVAYHAHKLAGYERRRLEAETSKAESEAVQARARTHFVEVNSGTFVLDGISVQAFYPAVNASKLLADIPQLALPAPAEAAPRFRRLVDLDFVHLLVVGPSGSGKSTVLCHLIDNEPGSTAVVVLDPHAGFNLWPSRGDNIIGSGRDYQAINLELSALQDRMNRRYNGQEGTSQRILIVCDEWLSVRDKCSDAEEFFNTLGSESRKVNMSLVISSISSTVDDLAVSGAIRDNLSQITLSPSLKAKNQALLRLSRKESETIELPGPYKPLAVPLGDRQRTMLPAPIKVEAIDFDPIDLDGGPVPPTPDPTELRIFELYQAGKSLRAIHKEAYGRPYAGGREVQELRVILGKFGVKFETEGDVAGDVTM